MFMMIMFVLIMMSVMTMIKMVMTVTKLRRREFRREKHETKGILRGDDDNCHPHHQYMNMMMNIQ